MPPGLQSIPQCDGSRKCSMGAGDVWQGRRESKRIRDRKGRDQCTCEKGGVMFRQEVLQGGR